MKKNLFNFSLVILALILFVSSCKKDDNGSTAPAGLIYTYYPTNVGHELIYDVTLITKDEFTQDHDTAIFQLKEVIESIFVDNQGRATQRLERYTRSTSNDPWVISDVWTSNLTTTHLERKEENVTYKKLLFPMQLNQEWNGNIFNTMGAMYYTYTDINVPGLAGSLYFDSTLTVIQTDESNCIDKSFSEEQFANHIGLIYKKEIYKLWQVPCDTFLNSQFKAQRLYTQTLVSYSN